MNIVLNHADAIHDSTKGNSSKEIHERGGESIINYSFLDDTGVINYHSSLLPCLSILTLIGLVIFFCKILCAIIRQSHFHSTRHQELVLLELIAMADAKHEARRQRILANAKKRLEKIEDLKHSSKSEHLLSEDELDVTHLNSDECKNSKVKEVPTPGSFNICETYVRDNENQKENDKFKKDDVELIENTETDDLSTSSTKTDSKPHKKETSWFFRKYRLLLFSLLAWVIYLVVVKDFDGIFAYIIGQNLPKKVLPTLILTTFVAVEFQVMLLGICLRTAHGESKHSQSMIFVVLQLSGVPKKVLENLGRLLNCIGSLVTDFCVYVFVIVILKTIDEFIY